MHLDVVSSGHIDARTRAALRSLWDRAFEEEFTDEDAEHAYGGVHVLARQGDDIVGHASAVPRPLRFGAGPWRAVGYVEAVATEPARQRQGIGRAVMLRLQQEMASTWQVAVLSTGRHGFYERLGWQRWQGLSFTRGAAGDVPDGEQDGLMLLRLNPDVQVDPMGRITCEDRPGDAW